MKLKEIHSALELQMPGNTRETFVDVESEKYKRHAVTLDLVYLDEVKSTFVVVNYRGLTHPKFVPLTNVRACVPYAPKEAEEKAPKKAK